MNVLRPAWFRPVNRAAIGFLFSLVAGCNSSPPATVSKAIDPESQAVSFLVDGMRAPDDQDRLARILTSLSGPGAECIARGAYEQQDCYFRVRPISDLQAAVEKIEFGHVLAVDPTDRVVLVDLLGKPAPKPADGWPGAKIIDEYVLRKTVTWAARYARHDWVVHHDWAKKFGPENIVVVALFEQPASNTVSASEHPVIKQLQAIAPEVCVSMYPEFGPQAASVVIGIVAPIKVSDLVKALQKKVGILTFDEQQHVVLLGALADLKPRRPSGTKSLPPG
jgi:hypothetical protein